MNALSIVHVNKSQRILPVSGSEVPLTYGFSCIDWKSRSSLKVFPS